MHESFTIRLAAVGIKSSASSQIMEEKMSVSSLLLSSIKPLVLYFIHIIASVALVAYVVD